MIGTDPPQISRWRSRLLSLPAFPGKLRLIDMAAAALRSIGKNTQKVCLWDGAEFYVDLRDRIQRQMWCGCYEPHVMRALRGILRAGDVFLDLERISGITPILPLDWWDRPDGSSPSRRILQ